MLSALQGPAALARAPMRAMHTVFGATCGLQTGLCAMRHPVFMLALPLCIALDLCSRVDAGISGVALCNTSIVRAGIHAQQLAYAVCDKNVQPTSTAALANASSSRWHGLGIRHGPRTAR